LRSAQREELRRVLESLPPHQRETLELVFYHGLSGPEAAEVLGVPAGTVKSRLSRALTSLRRLLEDDCGA
jgi:RNA polymerase sigma-70 factor (ECF subfamily)